MRADRVEISWDTAKSNWLVRIESGEEVLRRHCDVPKTVDEEALRAAARKTLQEEGYEPDVANITIQR